METEMKTGAPYIYVEKLDGPAKKNYDVHVAVKLDHQQKIIDFNNDSIHVEEGIMYIEAILETDTGLSSGYNWSHATFRVRGRQNDVKHIRINIPHDHHHDHDVDKFDHHTGGSGSFEP